MRHPVNELNSTSSFIKVYLFVYKIILIPGFVKPTKFTVISPSLVTFSRLTKSPLGISYLSSSSLLNMNPNLNFSKSNDMNKTNGSPTSIVTSSSTLCNYEKKDIGRYLLYVITYYQFVFAKMI